MPVITLAREMGSGGNLIAQAVAERLGLYLAGRELINQAARQAGVPEVALSEIDELGLLGMRPRPEAQRLYREMAGQMIRALAAKDDLLLVGRAGQVILADHPGALHVRVIAPLALRVQRVQEHCHIAPETATAMVEAIDRGRASYLRRHYRARWDDPTLYSMVLSTAKLSISAATDLICRAAEDVSCRGAR
jgi:cytidylate kinase